MNFRQESGTLLEVAKLYQQDMREAVNYLADLDAYEQMAQKTPKVDARDFVPMVALMGITGDTAEERAQDIHDKLDKMVAAFDDPDTSKRKPYLDLIYNLVDSFAGEFDPTTMDMDNREQVGKLLQSLIISQTIQTKMFENPDYYYDRYSTPESRNMMEACDRFRQAIGSTLMTNLSKNNCVINVKLSLPRPFLPDMMEFQHLWEEFEKRQMDTTIAKGGVLDSKTIDFPILDTMVPIAGKAVTDIPNFSAEDKNRLHNYYTMLVQNSQIQHGSKNVQGLKEAGISEVKEAVYIDGKPLEEFRKEHFPNVPKSGQLTSDIIATCMLGGKHKVDLVYAYRNEEGEMQYEAKALRVTVTPEQEKAYLQQFSRFRRFFNFGPFRIETLQEKMDRIANDPKLEERHTSIMEQHKEKIEAGFARLEKEAREAELRDARVAAHNAAYQKGKEDLDASAEQWDKESVIGILGQQIVGLCDTIRKGLMSPPPERYNKVCVPFAKMVLYSMLCTERAENGNQPSEAERLLGTNDTKTVQENIEDTAKQMAKNPIFMNTFSEMMGVEINGGFYPDRGKFEALIGNGGCERFRLECMRKLMENAEQREQPVAANENALAQQKQSEVSQVQM